MRFTRVATVLMLLGVAASAHAQITTYTASDPSVGPPGPFPNSNVSAGLFDTAAGLIGPETLVTFESAPVGAFSSLTVAPGATITGGGTQSIANAPDGNPAVVFGFNTTTGGANYLQLLGGSATFTFATPVSYFGAYLTGVQLGGETYTFNDGSAETVAIPNPGSGAEFLGITDTSSFSSVTIDALNDIIGVDDVRFGSPSVAPSGTPEPSAFAVFAISGLALGGFLRRRKLV